LLPRTLDSLAKAGFDRPRLFIDGAPCDHAYDHFGLETTTHYPCIQTFGNWVLSLWELYLRSPQYERYAIFQDDFVTYRNLREYLDSCEFPVCGYWNLYTFPKNQRRAPPGHEGWYLSDQLGKGAVALVFSLKGVEPVLGHPHMVGRPQSARGHRSVDGGIVTAFVKAGWQEYVHNPSLVQHTGIHSSMRNRKQQLAESFRGEEFDALDLLKKGDNA